MLLSSSNDDFPIFKIAFKTGGDFDDFPSRKPGSGRRLRVSSDFFGSSLRKKLSALRSCARPEIEQMIGGADGVLIVLYDDDGVSCIAQILQRCDEFFVVRLMKSRMLGSSST